MKLRNQPNYKEDLQGIIKDTEEMTETKIFSDLTKDKLRDLS